LVKNAPKYFFDLKKKLRGIKIFLVKQKMVKIFDKKIIVNKIIGVKIKYPT